MGVHYTERITRAGNRIGVFGEDVGTIQTWKIDHTETEFCWRIEDTIADGLALISFLRRLDNGYIESVSDNPDVYNEVVAKKIEGMFRNWLTATSRLFDAIDNPALAGFEISGLEELKKAYCETKEALEPDSDTLDNPYIIALRDHAIDEHRAGLSEPLTVKKHG